MIFRLIILIFCSKLTIFRVKFCKFRFKFMIFRLISCISLLKYIISRDIFWLENLHNSLMVPAAFAVLVNHLKSIYNIASDKSENTNIKVFSNVPLEETQNHNSVIINQVTSPLKIVHHFGTD